MSTLDSIPTARFGNLVAAETRKFIDTRASMWLLTAIGSLTVVLAGVWTALADRSARDGTVAWYGGLGVTSTAAAMLLPIMAILMATSEWSRRTAMTTFVMTPRRPLVTVAKGLVVVGAAFIGALLPTLVTAAAGLAVRVAHPDLQVTWSMGWKVILGSALAVVLQVLIGFALGMAFLSAPAAIVTLLAVPPLMPLMAMVPVLDRIEPWVNFPHALDPLLGGTISGMGWAHLASALGLWMVAPLVVGLWRQQVREP